MLDHIYIINASYLDWILVWFTPFGPVYPVFVFNIFTGAFQFYSKLQSIRLYQSTGTLHIFVMTAEIIYMLFILYYMYIQVRVLFCLCFFKILFRGEFDPSEVLK